MPYQKTLERTYKIAICYQNRILPAFQSPLNRGRAAEETYPSVVLRLNYRAVDEATNPAAAFNDAVKATSKGKG